MSATKEKTMGLHRTADPYRDLAVIDVRAPRFNQAVVGGLSALAVATGWWGLYAALAAQLVLGLTLGRRACLPCVFYFEVVQPRLGEGRLEDARLPRFANRLGATFLGAAALASALGFARVGAVVGGAVAVLALLAAATGLCVGCELYRAGARLRGVRARALQRLDLAELGVTGPGPAVVQFTHPLCSACQDMLLRLTQAGRRVVTVDISRRPELARKYGVTVVPLALEVRPDGGVVAQLTA